MTHENYMKLKETHTKELSINNVTGTQPISICVPVFYSAFVVNLEHISHGPQRVKYLFSHPLQKKVPTPEVDICRQITQTVILYYLSAPKSLTRIPKHSN